MGAGPSHVGGFGTEVEGTFSLSAGEVLDIVVGGVIRTIGQLLDTYSAEECANYFKNAGYAPA